MTNLSLLELGEEGPDPTLFQLDTFGETGQVVIKLQ